MAPLTRYTSEEIQVAMHQLDGWSLDTQSPSIYKEWRFNNFKTVIRFLNHVCELADQQDHHPEILTTYTKLRIRLWTHDASGITKKDFTLACAIDRLIANEFKEHLLN